MKRVIPPSELIINPDGSVFHLHIKPEMLADNIILVGDPARVDLVASFFDKKKAEATNREFHAITGEYRGKPIMCVSHGIGADNIDIVVNELDAAGKVAAVDGNGNRIGLTFSAVNTHSPEWYWNRLDTKPVNLV